MLEDKLYESDYFNIYVCQTYRTKYNKIKEQYHKELCIYLDFESDIFNYLFVALTYKKRSIVNKLKYDGVFIYNIYNLLFNDINSNNYISMKLS